MSPASEFFQLSKVIAEKFLQSAVIVDDLAGLGPRQEDAAAGGKAVQPPGRTRSSAPQENVEPSEPPAETAVSAEGETPAHFLNAKKVMDTFARKGIFCSVLKPEKEEMDGLVEVLRRLGDSADILVLDWQLDNDNGKRALAVLASILRMDIGRCPGRLRLVSVYTGDPDVQGIAGTIKEQLKEQTRIDFKEEGHLALTWPGGRIVVLAKPETIVLDQYRGNVVPFESLVERLTEEFTKLTEGLVSNVVVAALAEVRTNGSRILGRFSDKFDAPYLSHRFMLPEPEDAEAFLTMLIAEELLGILEEAQVGNAAGAKAIEAWLNAKNFQGLKIGKKALKKALLFGDVVSILGGAPYGDEDGDGNRIGKLRYAVENDIHKQDLTWQFEGASSTEPLDEGFAYLTMMRAYYHDKVPVLTLGTIVKGPDQELKYYVCMQPRCDSVRVEGSRSFPFLPLEPTTGNEQFNIVVLDNDAYVRLKCIRKPHKLVLFSFEPNPAIPRVVKARQEGTAYYYFEDASEPKKTYRWVGELRTEHALRLADDFAAVFGRVGLVEYEWLRRWAGKRE